MYEVIVFTFDDGHCPFDDWLSSIRDRAIQARILKRIRQVEAGNLGDSCSVGEGVIEFRIHIGPGYRVYFGRSGSSVVILLCGGDKSSQSKDLEYAKTLWDTWKRGHK